MCKRETFINVRDKKILQSVKLRQMEKKILEMRTAISQKKEEIFNKKNNIKLINLSDLLVFNLFSFLMYN